MKEIPIKNNLTLPQCLNGFWGKSGFWGKFFLVFLSSILLTYSTLTLYKPFQHWSPFNENKSEIISESNLNRCRLEDSPRKATIYSCLNWNVPKNEKHKVTVEVSDYHNNTLVQSTCSDGASSRGSLQRVVAFSFYGKIDHTRNYFKGIEENAKLMGKFYPNWTMRVYHDLPPLSLNLSIQNELNISSNNRNNVTQTNLKALSNESSHSTTLNVTPQEILCQLQCLFPFLDLCYVGNIPSFGNLLGSQGNMWRFLPMADPLVDIFVSRDLDSRLSNRESEAVKEWINSNLTFHIMRDNPKHSTKILAGMWGAAVHKNREKLSNLTRIMMEQGKTAKNKGLDQFILRKILWPVADASSMQHDSYTCRTFGKKHKIYPWPTRRIDGEKHNFVGARIGVDNTPLAAVCPVQCRPKNKKHWTHC